MLAAAALPQSRYGRAGGGAAGSVGFGASFAGSDVAGVLGAVLILSGGDAPVLGGTARSQAVRPSEMRHAAARVILFMLLLSLETKVLRVIRHASFDITRSRHATGKLFAAQQDKAHR